MRRVGSGVVALGLSCSQVCGILVPQPAIKPDSLPYKADSFLKNNFMYLFLAVLGLRCCAGFFLVAESLEHSLGVVQGLLNAVDCLVAEQFPGHADFSSCSSWQQLSSCSSQALEHRLNSCGAQA